MEVSHFELIFKPQSPAGDADTVLQGYFLEITNLEAKEMRYSLQFVAVPPAPGQTFRSLAGNAVVFVDTPAVNNQAGVLNGTFNASTFTPSTGLIVVPPRATALVAVLPSAFPPGATPDPTPLPGPVFEVRGFVRITLPPLRVPGGSFFQQQAQAAGPVRTMLTPQFRATYFGKNGKISDQTQASVPTATGAGLYEIPPQLPFFVIKDLVAQPSLVDMLDLIPVEERPSLLGALLAAVDVNESDFAGFNKMLAGSGIDVELARKLSRKPERLPEKV